VPHRAVIISLFTALALAAGLWLARPAPISAVDQEQPRLNLAAPTPRGAAVLTQTLVAGHDGFSALDLLAVVYPNNPPAARLTVELARFSAPGA
jgi:hypothetical protein